jgi:hypothetical protein
MPTEGIDNWRMCLERTDAFRDRQVLDIEPAEPDGLMARHRPEGLSLDISGVTDRETDEAVIKKIGKRGKRV